MRSARFVRACAAVLYLTAGIASAGIPLCTGADGRALYKLDCEDCCGEPPPAGDACCGDDACPEDVPALSAGPDCGGCHDAIHLLDGGLTSGHAAPGPIPAITPDPVNAGIRLEGGLPRLPDPDPPPLRPAVLRC